MSTELELEPSINEALNVYLHEGPHEHPRAMMTAALRAALPSLLEAIAAEIEKSYAAKTFPVAAVRWWEGYRAAAKDHVRLVRGLTVSDDGSPA